MVLSVYVDGVVYMDIRIVMFNWQVNTEDLVIERTHERRAMLVRDYKTKRRVYDTWTGYVSPLLTAEQILKLDLYYQLNHGGAKT